MKLRKATAEEKAQYAARTPTPLYPLTHWVMAGGHLCAVEGLFEGDGDPEYEIIFPDGLHDEGYGTHSFLCFSLADVKERAGYASFVPCTEECH